MPKSTNRRRYASPVSKLETQKQVRFAWAYIHQQSNADQHTPEEVRTIKILVRRAAEALGGDLPTPKLAPAGD
jgi:hypothetical protein